MTEIPNHNNQFTTLLTAKCLKALCEPLTKSGFPKPAWKTSTDGQSIQIFTSCYVLINNSLRKNCILKCGKKVIL